MIDPNILAYLNDLQPSENDLVGQMKEEAKRDHVPIMEQQGISFLQQLIRIKQPDKILEIGTAIGYSSLMMLEAKEDMLITTVERNKEMIERAKYYIQAQEKTSHIEIIEKDALEAEVEIKDRSPFDIIFIDAAKGQYQRFFQLYEPYLKDDGMIITDNVLFKGLVATKDNENKRLQKIANKINQYNQWLIEHPMYHTTVLPIGDGVAISVKNKQRCDIDDK
ncbi:O-methyltransferase [Gracilibacillus sp. YIM 98692]|uniref:O-methyltransferase n=1 Tax=Gracilibacillus sp. YIM 98692 TaxID=2663532 RepID=UPI0013D52356|nr:O-methyltransferase [Gracilibacillus sp. YIM 98692]